MPKITRETLRQMIAEEITRSTKPKPKEIKITSDQLRSIIMQEVRQLSEQDAVQVIDGEETEIVAGANKEQMRELQAALKKTGDEKEGLPADDRALDELLAVADPEQAAPIVAHYVNQQTGGKMTSTDIAKLTAYVLKNAKRVDNGPDDLSVANLKVKVLISSDFKMIRDMFKNLKI
jgi:hypothetical protein